MSASPWKMIGTVALAGGLLMAGCSDDEDVEQTADTVGETIEDAAGEVGDAAEDAANEIGDAAEDAWPTLETNFERLVDEIRTGDNDAREELLDSCRDTLQSLREADDPDADRVESLCDRIRDAASDADWDELRREVEDISAGR